jgi:uncharacterized membrane protein
VPDVRGHRRAYIDWARGIAVLLMIEAHTLDAWTRPTSKHGVVFRDATVLGGFAAPMFLWLSGLGLILSATRTLEKTSSLSTAVRAACARGLTIFVLAFLFRIQAFIVSPGSHPITLFRVDILNVMGPALVVTGLIWGMTHARLTPRATTAASIAAFGAVAVAIAMVTPPMRYWQFVTRLPTWMTWYVRPSGDHTTFTLLPWSAFVFAGAATGSLLAVARDEAAERRVQGAVLAAGAAVIALGFWTAGRPTIYRSSSFWTSSPTWFAIRVGILMVSLPAFYLLWLLVVRAGVALSALEKLGRRSLFVYWIHVELVYGYASWLWRHRLPLWGTALAYMVFCALMYGAIVLRDWVVGGGLYESSRFRATPGHWRRGTVPDV